MLDLICNRKEREFQRYAYGRTARGSFGYEIGGTHGAARSRNGAGGSAGISREALVDGDVDERGEPVREEAHDLVGVGAGGREPGGAARGALEGAPAGADEGACVEVALVGADAAEHVLQEVLREEEVYEVGAPHLIAAVAAGEKSGGGKM
jgi:hypothetical protein